MLITVGAHEQIELRKYTLQKLVTFFLGTA